jgi:hypothetical protein
MKDSEVVATHRQQTARLDGALNSEQARDLPLRRGTRQPETTSDRRAEEFRGMRRK